jgi:pimeloyl-ACP methyl ester carboxylesterase
VLTTDGVELATREWAASGRARAVVVLVHGFASSKDDRNVVRLAEHLVRRDLDVRAYDARGHGASGGVCTLGDLEARDVAAAVVWAQRPGTPIVLVGASMGGIAVLRHASTGPDVTGLVVVSTPSEWRMPLRIRALVTAGLTRTKPGRWVAARRLRVRIHPVWTAAEPPRVLVSRVRSPLAIVHGVRDLMIPHRAALELHLEGEPDRRLVLVPDMGHAFDPVGHSAIAEAVDWIISLTDSSDN